MGTDQKSLPHPCPSVFICGKNSSRKCTTLNYCVTEIPARPAATEEIQPRINTDGHGSEVIAHPCPSVFIRGKNSSRKCTTLNYCVTKRAQGWVVGMKIRILEPVCKPIPSAA